MSGHNKSKGTWVLSKFDYVFSPKIFLFPGLFSNQTFCNMVTIKKILPTKFEKDIVIHLHQSLREDSSHMDM